MNSNYDNEPEECQENAPSPLSLATILAFARKMPQYLLLGIVLIVGCMSLALLADAIIPPVYTATAIVSQPANSPTSSMLGGSQISSSLLGSSNVGSTNYQSFLQIMGSARMAKGLIDDKQIDRVLFADMWDDNAKRWIVPSGPLASLKTTVKGWFHRPTWNGPGADDVVKYIEKRLKVTKIETGSSPVLTRDQPTFYRYEVREKSPEAALSLLNAMIDETDLIIRRTTSVDVNTRIAYLRRAIPTMGIAEERSALISVLSDQERLMVLLNSDRHFAIALISPPYASALPVSPPAPTKVALIGVLLGILAWMGLVFLAGINGSFERLIAWSHRR